MILTGKCKKDFFNSKLGKNDALFYAMQPIYQNALIIEWFDSVGIYIDIQTQKRYTSKDDLGTNYFLSFIEELNIKDLNGDYLFINRKDATFEAIKQANKIYNEEQ